MKPVTFPGVEQLLEQAGAACGLTDFGTGFEEPLAVLVEAIRTDVPVSADNIPLLAGPILKLLVSRAYSQRGWKARPDCLQHRLRAPLVVTGIPRTGTTALHKLLSMDAQFQGLEQWLIGTPMPRPPRASWDDNPLYRAAVDEQRAFLEAVPALRVAHEVDADEVDECLNLLAQSFVSHYPATGIGLPHYDSWWWSRDETASYRRYADNLRLIGANAPGQRWLLKNPGHITHLDALLAVFPDAMVIQTHRDPAKSIPSVCGVIWPARCFFHARQVPAAEVGSRELEFWARSLERAETVRKDQPERFIDVRFDDFKHRPMAVVRDIYRHFDLDLQPASERRMAQWLASNARHKHGRHEYSPAQYGLSEQAIRERFADYIRKYELQS
ncbi:MAG: sulfotransferase [Halioglobus sp.]|nr:sulfotransferase [Halioglobus sp.]